MTVEQRVIQQAKNVYEKYGAVCQEEITRKTKPSDLDFDMLDVVEFMMNCEREFNKGITDEQAANIKNMGDIIDHFSK